MAKIKHTIQTKVWNSETLRYEAAPVDIVIDLDKLAFKLVGRAYRSKAGKARALHGAIVVTAKVS